ncbi:hypothetical protein [Bacillus sp. Marseille-P3661]|uniref:hypothetical protein n=1 Tax=Bacillus sp. Marseille-P3661 TaxID=1936234 RepID=UPI000C84CC70|nr:hypothetical protein [Bacillus sp. Marseille-P3661]
MRFKSLILAVTLTLSSCSSSGQPDAPKVQLSSSISGEKEVENGENTWIDITTNSGEVKYDMTTNAKDFIAQKNNAFQNITKNLNNQENKDVYYDYYVAAMELERGLQFVEVEGVSIRKDFNNLQHLTRIIKDEQQKRVENSNPADFGEYKTAMMKDWKAPSDRMKRAINYLTKLLNDLDITINHDGNGKIFGYAYQEDGPKTVELETFLQEDIQQQ